MRLLIAVALLLGSLGATAGSRSDPMTSLRFLVGNWTCTYHQGPARLTYKATFEYALGGNWLRERDSSSAGFGGEGLLTYQPKQHAWIVVVVVSDRSATLFKGTGPPAHVLYRSVYPDASMTEHIDHTSPTQYTVHFSQTAKGKTITSNDICTRS